MRGQVEEGQTDGPTLGFPAEATGKLRIEVVVPVRGRADLTHTLLECIARQVSEVERLTVIDNGGDAETENLLQDYSGLLPLRRIRPIPSLGVNASWNAGLSLATCPLVSVLNNDLILPEGFFLRVKDSFNSDARLGMVVPALVSMPADVRAHKGQAVRLEPLRRREGWAFTLRKEVFERAGPIPEGLETYFGDDYLFAATLELGFLAARMMNVGVYHYENATVRETSAFARYEKDRAAWFRVVASRIVQSGTPRVWAEVARGHAVE
ncbi:MAG TPA: glycosyltransferase family A protein [Thermoanaerobaculaceae bacterium]|mgnify:CR=1 FL=1|nr:glycosyltransferase family A protein [Thermoanaerobaculaceae bacterium]HRS17112.1 glycosyltransferase family A protein [Thermoanaerobaculaceae bacterium]